MNLCVQIALVFNQYVNPIGLENLGWKYYIFYCVWIAIELVVVYLCEFANDLPRVYSTQCANIQSQSMSRPRDPLSRRSPRSLTETMQWWPTFTSRNPARLSVVVYLLRTATKRATLRMPSIRRCRVVLFLF